MAGSDRPQSGAEYLLKFQKEGFSWPRNIDQWRKYAVWEGYGIPPDLILSIIRGESAGKAGEPGRRRSASRDYLPKMDGSKIFVDRALGLMQCVPSTILWFNKEHPQKPAFYEDMIGSNDRAVRMQIKIGAWLLKHNINQLSSFYPKVFPHGDVGRASEEHLKLALVAYGAGMGALKRRLDKLVAKGEPLTLQRLQFNFPYWGYDRDTKTWKDRPLQSAHAKWLSYQWRRTGRSSDVAPHNPTGQPPMPRREQPTPLMTPPGTKPPGPTTSPLMILGLLLIAWMASQKLFGGKKGWLTT